MMAKDWYRSKVLAWHETSGMIHFHFKAGHANTSVRY
jgi:hypothetical protein